MDSNGFQVKFINEEKVIFATTFWFSKYYNGNLQQQTFFLG